MRLLSQAPLGRDVAVRGIEGPRAFRRRLLEMGLVPGVRVRVIAVAPLGDPLQIEVRGGQWSLRRAEAAQIAIDDVHAAQPIPAAPAPRTELERDDEAA
ncbi:MAG: ferrous iron transport protein A [Kofleriaceae bacterium]